MALLGYSDDFDLDDDGILRDDGGSTGFLIDDHGIVRDDSDFYNQITTQWTDSGLGGDKRSSTSTLKHLDFPGSFEEDIHLLDERSLNISELEASKDFTFDTSYVSADDLDFLYDSRGRRTSNYSGIRDSGNFTDGLKFQDTDVEDGQTRNEVDAGELYDEEYYQQLKDYGVLIDGADLSYPRQSLLEFETLENQLKPDQLREDDPLAYYLQANEQQSIRSGNLQSGFRDGSFQLNSEHFPSQDTNRGFRDGSFQLNSEHFPSQDTNSGGFRDGSFQLNSDHFRLQDTHNSGYRDGSFQLNSEHFKTQKSNVADLRQSFDDPRKFDYRTLENNRPSSRGAQSDAQGSDKTVSSRSFPEVSPEEALDLYNESRRERRRLPDPARIPFVDDNDGESLDLGGSSKHDPDDIFYAAGYVNRRVSTSPPLYTRHGSNQSVSHSSNARSRTPVNADKTQISGNNRYETRQKTSPSSHVTSDTTPRSRPSSDTADDPITRKRNDSGGSHRSTVSEVSTPTPTPKRTVNRRSSPQAIRKARSQESFFEAPNGEKSEKQPKRILPKPNMTNDQSFKLKSKSTTNISSKPGPVKPTHMSLSEITSLMVDDGDDLLSETQSVSSERSKGELAAKLNQESSQRKQATELVHQLQKDYDNLLSKYALAELTIDQLRLGAKITLHSDSPTPSQAYSGTLVAAQQPQISNLANNSRGIITSSPAPGKAGRFSPLPMPDAADLGYTHVNVSDINRIPSLTTSSQHFEKRDNNAQLDVSVGATAARSKGTSPVACLTTSEGQDNVKVTMGMQTRGMDERLESFKHLLDEGHLTIEEQEKVFDKLRADHDKLRRNYLQAKEDYDVLRRTGASTTDTGFDEDKELEGELFRLGMKFDDIHERVDNNLKMKSSERQPFKNQRSRTGTPDPLDGHQRSIDHLKPKFTDPNAGNDLVKSKPGHGFDDKLQRLHNEYNALMAHYRRLKQMSRSADRESEIDQLVKKLWDICEEAPDIFKMPKEIQDQLDAMHRADRSQRLSPSISLSSDDRGQMDASPTMNQSGLLGRDRDSPGSLRLSQLEGTPKKDKISDADRRKLEDLKVGRFSPMGSERGSDSPAPRIRNGRASPMNPRNGQALNTRGGRGSPLNRTSPVSQSRDWGGGDVGGGGGNMKKDLESGSLSSIPDSGISEHSQSNLPTTGTKSKFPPSRRDFDTDSGFIGSVASYGSAQRQPNLVLRRRASTEEERLQEVEEGAVGGRDSPGPGNMGRGENSQRRRMSDQVDQSANHGDLTESEVSDYDLQQRRVPQNKNRSRPDIRDKPSRSEEGSEDDVEDTKRPLRMRQRNYSSDEGITNSQNQRKSKVSEQPNRGEMATPKKVKPKIYYSEDSQSEDEEDTYTVQKSSRTRTGSGDRSRLQPDPESAGRARSQIEAVDRSKSKDTPGSKSGHGSRRSSDESFGSVRSGGRPRSRPGSAERSSTLAGSGERPASRRGSGDGRNIRKYNKYSNNKKGSEEEGGSRAGSSQSHERSRLQEADATPLNGATDTQRGQELDASQRVSNTGNSSRLKALQKEIERLKNDVKKVNNGIQEPAEDTPHKQESRPRLRYDPDDPFGFMEGQDEGIYPRRRANSFSGSPARHYDDWYMFQPLLPRRQPEQESTPAEQLRRNARGADMEDGVIRRKSLAGESMTRRDSPISHETRKNQRPLSASATHNRWKDLHLQHERSSREADISESDEQSTPRNAREHQRPASAFPRADNLYNYYIPTRYSDQEIRQGLTGTSRPYRTTSSGGRAYPVRATTPTVYSGHQYDDAVTMETQTSATPQYYVPSGYVYYAPADGEAVTSYVATPMRSSSPIRAPRGADMDHNATAQPAPMYSALQPAMCPHCGQTSYHTHATCTFPAPPVAEEAVTSRRGRSHSRGRSHQRSRSLSKHRYYTPDRDPDRYKYHVREVSHLLSESESEDERPRRTPRFRSLSRSRSVSRSRSRKGRRYHRSRSQVLLDDSDSDSSISEGYAPSLDSSIGMASRAARNIDHLTQRMMTTVQGEISKHRRKRENSARKSSRL